MTVRVTYDKPNLFLEQLYSEALTLFAESHMGQFLQGGKNGRLMSFFFKSRASV